MDLKEKYNLERMDYLYIGKASVLLLSILCSFIFIKIFYEQVPFNQLLLWFVAFMSYISIRLLQAQRYIKKRKSSEYIDPKSWEYYYAITAGIGGLIWGAGGFILISPDFPIGNATIISILLIGISASAIPGNASSFLSCNTFNLGIMIPTIFTAHSFDFDENNFFVVMLVIHTVSMTLVSKKMNRFISSSIDLRLRNEQLNVEKDYAEELAINSSKLAMVGELATGIAHEINNPLLVIKGNSKILSKLSTDGKLSAQEFEKYKDKSDIAVDRITKIIENLKRVGPNLNDRQEKSEIGIKELIEGAMMFYQEKLQGEGIEFKLVDETNNKKINCDVSDMTQVFASLFSNSIEAIKNLNQKWIKIFISLDGKSVIVRLVDSGEGIEKSVGERLFVPFFSTKDVGKGTGLGLSVSRGIVMSNNGNIYYDNQSNNTTFVVELPTTDQAISH